jgi:hypothetical protein
MPDIKSGERIQSRCYFSLSVGCEIVIADKEIGRGRKK